MLIAEYYSDIIEISNVIVYFTWTKYVGADHRTASYTNRLPPSSKKEYLVVFMAEEIRREETPVTGRGATPVGTHPVETPKRIQVITKDEAENLLEDWKAEIREMRPEDITVDRLNEYENRLNDLSNRIDFTQGRRPKEGRKLKAYEKEIGEQKDILDLMRERKEEGFSVSYSDAEILKYGIQEDIADRGFFERGIFEDKRARIAAGVVGAVAAVGAGVALGAALDEYDVFERIGEAAGPETVYREGPDTTSPLLAPPVTAEVPDSAIAGMMTGDPLEIPADRFWDDIYLSLDVAEREHILRQEDIINLNMRDGIVEKDNPEIGDVYFHAKSEDDITLRYIMRSVRDDGSILVYKQGAIELSPATGLKIYKGATE